MYHKTNVTGLQRFLRGKFASWASNCRCVQKIWKGFKEIFFNSINRIVPHKILRKIPNSAFYSCNKEVKRLKVKFRRVYNKRKLGQQYQVEVKKTI